MVISLVLGVITGFYDWKYSVLLFGGLIFMLTIVLAVRYSYGLFDISKYQLIILGICLCFFCIGVYRCRDILMIYETCDKLQYSEEDIGVKKEVGLKEEEISKKTIHKELLKYNEYGKLVFQGKVIEIERNAYGYSIILEKEEGCVYVYTDETLCGFLEEALDEQGVWNGQNQGETSNIEDEIYRILYGKKVCVVGDIIPMKRARNYGNYDEYTALRSKGVLLKISAESLKISGSARTDGFSNSIYDFDDRTLTIRGLIAKTKLYLRDVLRNIATEEEYGILAAMVLGESDDINMEIKELYSISGISHIMAISGLHISLIGMGIYKLLRKRLRYISSSSISIGIMSFFLVFIGNPISATRAVIMFFVHIIADLYGRKYDVLSALSLAAVFLLVDNPYYLLNTSFQLSFAAMIAVCVCVPIVTEFIFGENEDNKLRKLSKKKNFDLKEWLKDGGVKFGKMLAFNITLSIVLIPINSFLFFRHSTYAPSVNMIVVPLVGIALVMTLVGMFTAIIIPGVGSFFVGTAIYLLRFFTWLSERVARLPYSSIVTGKLSFWEVVLCYVILGISLSVMYRYRINYGKIDARNINQNICLIVFISIYVLTIFRNKYDGFSICFLDVGQGAAIYIKSDTGNDYLIDGGSSDEKNIGEYKIGNFLEARQVSELECVFVTHCDTDHISGIVELIERGNILIDKLVLPDISLEGRDEKYVNLVMVAEKSGVEVLYMKSGDRLSDGELQFTCINPGAIRSGAVAVEKMIDTDINESSLVLVAEYRELVAVFTGDIGKETENKLVSILKRLDLDNKLVVYDVAHHGSKNSNSEEFISIIKPRVAVISCGKDNSYGHPAPEVIERLEAVGSDVWCTYKSGQVEVYKGKDGIMIKGYVADDEDSMEAN